MDLVNHVARKHYDQEDAGNTQCQSTPEEDKEEEKIKFCIQ